MDSRQPTRLAAAIVILLAAASLGAQSGHRYDELGYDTSEPTDSVARLEKELSQSRPFEFDPIRGYLPSLLRSLDISIDSQLLVFSKTSFQVGLISPETPRAIYFNDDSYVAWEQGSRSVEVATMDPMIGPRFYSVPQDPDTGPTFKRQGALCLRCHDSTSLGGDGYPRLLMGSGITDDGGRVVSHEGWMTTDQSTPLAKRWGGWYITGRHASQPHGGNRIARLVDDGARWEISEGANLSSLEQLLDVGPYLSGHSDIVAAMVLEHQVQVQNAMTRLRWYGDEAAVASVVRALSLADEAPFSGPIEGTSGFAKRFSRLGPTDARGRSLRELELSSRLFKYPLSYLVSSDAFRALPERWKGRVVSELRQSLSNQSELGLEALEIWKATDPDLVGN